MFKPEAATAAALQGWNVLPVHGVLDAPDGPRCTCTKGTLCDRPGKHPDVRSFDDATTDPATLQRWALTKPDRNIAVLTGIASRLLILDFDAAPDQTADDIYLALQADPDVPDLPATYMTRTGGGGLHLYYRIDPQTTSTCPPTKIRIRPGLDVKGEQGYALIPPSSHASAPGAAYRNIPGSDVSHLATLTPELAQWIQAQPSTASGSAQPGRGALSRLLFLDHDPANATKPEYRIPEGERDATFFRLASKLRGDNVPLSEATALIQRIHTDQTDNPTPPTFPLSAALEKLERVYATFDPNPPPPPIDPEAQAWAERASRPLQGGIAPLTETPPPALPGLPTTGPARKGSEIHLARGLLDQHARHTPSNELTVAVFKRYGERHSEYAYFELPEGGGSWAPSPDGVKDLALHHMSPMLERTAQSCTDQDEADFYLKAAARYDTVTGCRRIAEAATALPEVKFRDAAPSSIFDRTPHMLSCPNGILNLHTLQLRPTVPSDRTHAVTQGRFLTNDDGTPYTEEQALAAAPLWDAFLTRIQPDPEVRLYLRRMIGMSLFSESKEEVFFLLDGSGANGKTTFVQTITQVLGGGYATSAPKSVFVSRSLAEMSTNDIATMEGKRIATNGTELSERDTLNDEIIKSLVSLEPMQVRNLYANFHRMVPTATLWLITNHLPHVRDTGYGMKRRIRRIRFDVQIPPEDRIEGYHNLLTSDEADGILTLAVLDAHAWYHGPRPYPSPEDAREDTEEYLADEDPLSVFINRFLRISTPHSPDPKDFTSNSDVYHCYATWCAVNGTVALSERSFFRRLSVPTGRITPKAGEKQVRGRWCEIIRWPDVPDEERAASSFQPEDVINRTPPSISGEHKPQGLGTWRGIDL